MSTEKENENQTNTVGPIRFDVDQAKKTTQQIMEVEAGEVAGQEIYEESPTRHEFVRFRGNSWGELLKVFAVNLKDPDGDPVKYVIQTKDNHMLKKIFHMLDDKPKEHVLAPYVSVDGVERVWCANFKWTGKASKKGGSVKQAIILGQQDWVKVMWNKQRGFITRPPGGPIDKKPEWSTLTVPQLINVAFEDKIITDVKHEAVQRNWYGQ
jgi:hypothetical protein|tara:strand:- start:109 stop:738 length:630 start_codon:yes stop_codon:yes gene_type:complete